MKAVLAVAVVVALSSASATAAPPRTHAWDCEGMAVVTTSDGPEPLVVFLPERTLRLAAVSSASGARFAGEDVGFWSKDDEARLEIEGQEPRRCTLDPKKTILEDAKLRGVDYRGQGNEPGWVLEIGPEQFVFEYEYGESKAEFPLSEPSVDAEARRTIYESSSDGRSIRITIEGKTCKDTMADESYETTLTVGLGEREFRGCGQALH
jgi:membrane-bound inhibitor of C-type lysozyme/uncharacterized membrane protein